MILLDGSIVNIVLPSIQRDVHGTIAGLQWVVTIYTIPLASVLLTAGDLGDRLGTRRLFVWSLGLFTVASLCCAASPSLEVLLAARAVQGVAAGGVLPTTLAIIAHAYRDNTRRTKAITTWAASGGLALLLGPVLGGLLTEIFSWRAVFFVNLPIGLVALALALRHLRQATVRSARTPDLLGQAVGVLALAALVAGLIEGGSRGWAVPSTLVLLTVSVLGIATFVVVERRSSHPVLPPAIFRRKEFTASIVCGQAYQIGSFGMQFMLAIFVQEQWHVDTARTGVLFLPFSIGSVVGVLALNRGLLRLGPRRLLSVGSVMAFAGAVVMLGVSGHEPSWPVFAVGTALIGLGSGMFAPSINAVTMQSIEPEYSGLASGVLNTARQIGMAVGVAVLGAFIAMSDPVLGLRIGMGLVGLCFLTVLVLGLRFVPARRR
jgi:EmrB/QacA subfamily drug resistance transporter